MEDDSRGESFSGFATQTVHGMTNRLSTFLAAEDDTVSKGEVFLGLFLKAQGRIFAYILTLLPHRGDAEDLMQEVSLFLWNRFDPANPPADFVAWGCRVAYFRIKEHRRAHRRQRVIFSDDILEQLAGIMAEETTALRLDDRFEALARCLAKLGRRDRELIAERLQEGATTLSTAERVGRSVDAVYKAMARIRKALYDCVERTLAAEERP
jgi:RNA polymerase sigma-70 factor (ECF subfamily)